LLNMRRSALAGRLKGVGNRNSFGERNSRNKLTTELWLKIFELRSQGHTQQFIAKKVGASQGQISVILRGKQWSHLFGQKRTGGFTATPVWKLAGL
jgi:hypothetical protein